MNRKFLKLSLLSLCAVMSLIVGCGPQDMNDANYLAETANSDVIENTGDFGNTAQPEAAAPAETGDSAGQEGGGAGAPPADKPEGCPVGSHCPSGNCETPGDPDTMRKVQLPDRISTEPTKVTPTSEQQLSIHTVDYHTTHHINQPSERHHTTHKHAKTVRRHFLKKVYHPTHRRINTVVRTSSVEDQVMPTEEVVEPVIDYGCENPPPPAPVVRPVIVRPVPVPVFGHYRGFHPYRF